MENIRYPLIKKTRYERWFQPPPHDRRSPRELNKTSDAARSSTGTTKVQGFSNKVASLEPGLLPVLLLWRKSGSKIREKTKRSHKNHICMGTKAKLPPRP